MPQAPDNAPGNYYVTVQRPDRRKPSGFDVRPLAGPYINDHAAALADVDKAAALACDMDPGAAFYAFGTTRLPETYSEPGILNKLGKM